MYGVEYTPRLSISASGGIGAAGSLGLIVYRLVFNLDVAGGAALALGVVINTFADVAADAAQLAAMAMSILHVYSLRVVFLPWN